MTGYVYRCDYCRPERNHAMYDLAASSLRQRCGCATWDRWQPGSHEWVRMSYVCYYHLLREGTP